MSYSTPVPYADLFLTVSLSDEWKETLNFKNRILFCLTQGRAIKHFMAAAKQEIRDSQIVVLRACCY